MPEQFQNGEIGSSVREKINQTINIVKELDSDTIEGEYYVTTGAANAYVITPGVTFTLKVGTLFKARFHVANTNTSITLNFGATGAYPCYRNLTTVIKPGEIEANGVYLVMYIGNAWSIIGTRLLVTDSFENDSNKALSARLGYTLNNTLTTLSTTVGTNTTDISGLKTSVANIKTLVKNDVAIAIAGWTYESATDTYVTSITVTGATALDSPHAGFHLDSYDEVKKCGIKAITSGTNVVKIYLEALPTTVINLDVTVIKGFTS